MVHLAEVQLVQGIGPRARSLPVRSNQGWGGSIFSKHPPPTGKIGPGQYGRWANFRQDQNTVVMSRKSLRKLTNFGGPRCRAWAVKKKVRQDPPFYKPRAERGKWPLCFVRGTLFHTHLLPLKVHTRRCGHTMGGHTPLAKKNLRPTINNGARLGHRRGKKLMG